MAKLDSNFFSMFRRIFVMVCLIGGFAMFLPMFYTNDLARVFRSSPTESQQKQDHPAEDDSVSPSKIDNSQNDQGNLGLLMHYPKPKETASPSTEKVDHAMPLATDSLAESGGRNLTKSNDSGAAGYNTTLKLVKPVSKLDDCLDGNIVNTSRSNISGSDLFTKANKPISNSSLAEQVAARLKSLYISKVQKHFSNNCTSVKVIEYNCVDGTGISLCGGFGDRSRGLVSMFYMALMTNSIFHVNWTIPIDLGLYFELNADLYQVPRAVFKEAVTEGNLTVRCLTDNDSGIKNYVQDPGFLNEQAHRKVAITTNSLMGFVTVLRQPEWASNVYIYFSDLNWSKLNGEILVSAALRFVYGKPKPELRREIEKVIGERKQYWETATKIGVQVRLENLNWNEHSRVSLNQVPCFIEEVLRLIRQLNISRPLVYVTSDNTEATATLLNMFQQAKIEAFSDDLHTELLHTDRTGKHQQATEHSSPNQVRLIWKMHVRGFVDWLMLTKMDYLVISRSGFSETAHMYSLAPTRRFVHQKIGPNNTVVYNDKCRFETYSLPEDMKMEINKYTN